MAAAARERKMYLNAGQFSFSRIRVKDIPAAMPAMVLRHTLGCSQNRSRTPWKIPDASDGCYYRVVSLDTYFRTQVDNYRVI